MFGFNSELDLSLSMHSARAWREEPEQCRRASQYAIADATLGASANPPEVPEPGA